MWSLPLTPAKTFLTGVDEVDDIRHDGPSYRGSQKPIVGVSDAKGTGVGDEAGEFFREDEEETVVEAIRGGMTPHDGLKNVVEDGGG